MNNNLNLNNLKNWHFFSILSSNTLMYIEKYIQEPSFNENKDFKNIKLLLEYIRKTYNLEKEFVNYKILISSLIIHYFPDEILSKKRNETENELYDKSRNIYDYIHNSKINIETFKNKLFTFGIKFCKWKNLDKISQLDILSEIYYRYKETYDELENKVYNNKEIQHTYKTEMRAFLNIILINMKKLDKNYQKYLSKYKFKNIDYDEKAKSFIYNKLKDIFWKELYIELVIKQNYKIIDTIIFNYIDILNLDNNTYPFDLNDIIQYKGQYTVNDIIQLTKTLLNINTILDNQNKDIYQEMTDSIKLNNIINILTFVFERIHLHQ